MNKLPHLLVLFDLYSNEKQAFRKIHRMIDLFESIIKTHTVVILSEYVRHNNLSESAKGLLAQGLKTPSLGTWQLFSRVLFEELQKDNFNWTFSNFSSEFIALDKALNSEKTNIIAMRNAYAHGATPSDEQCDADVNKFESFLLKLMGLNWLVGSSISVEDGKVNLIASAGGKLSLHPLLLHRNEDCDASFAFFNDLKNDKVGLLNYPLGKHYKEREFYSEFLEILPLNEWKSSGNNEFQQRIDELTETFKGRTLEREKLLQFVIDKNKGYFSIQGNPGIGKSALIAQFFKDLKHHEISTSLGTVEYFIRRGTQQAQVDFMLAYLIRRTDEYFPAGKEIRAEGKTTYDVQSQLFAKWRLWSEQSKGQKLLVLIDGLDEGAENNVLTYLPRENFENILFIYGSRPGGHKSIDDLWATLPTEHHTKVELQGLGKEDIRALIYEVANKYEIERESPWIDAVQIKSQGNPLYLKLLCDSLEYGGVAVNDVHALPDKIDEYYKAILNRYAQDAIDGDSLLFSLFTFAAARDYLTNAHIGHINKLGPGATQRVCTTLKEVLYENPLTEEVLDYQLFHESFREYLIREFAKEVQDASYRIIDFCSRWYKFEGSWEQRYALEHYAFHLYSSGMSQHHEALLNLITDNKYTATQKEILKSFEPAKRLFQLALKKSIELQKEDQLLESALQLVDLKYEESNDAPQVVALASSGIPGEIELALKRIENFSGVDADGVQRKFTLYMLCLVELTLLESCKNPNRKVLIERLLNHLDEHLPHDHSVLNWSNFFSSYLVFFMACEWSAIGLDPSVVFKRASSFKLDRIIEKVRNNEILVLREAVFGFSDRKEKCIALSAISGELTKQGQSETAVETAHGINDAWGTCDALVTISSEHAKQGQLKAAASVLQEALETASIISEDWEKNSALKDISVALCKLGQVEESLSIARGIGDDGKSSALRDISIELSKQGQAEESALVMQESLSIVLGISDEWKKSRALRGISVEMNKLGQLEQSLSIARGISDDPEKCYALRDISAELSELGQVDESASLMQESLSIAHGISDDQEKCYALINISSELIKQKKREEAATAIQAALETSRGIKNKWEKNNTLSAISSELAMQGHLELALETARNISAELRKNTTLKNISEILANQCQFESSLETARCISDERLRIRAIRTIASEFAKQDQLRASVSVLRVSLEIARGNKNERAKGLVLLDISSELAKQGHHQSAIETAYGNSNEGEKIKALRAIASEFAKQGKFESALEIASGTSNNWVRNTILCSISSELAKQGHGEAATSVMQDALETARTLSNKWGKCIALIENSNELARQGQLNAAASAMKEALETTRDISDEGDKNDAFRAISSALAIHGQNESAIETASRISDEGAKSSALSVISIEHAKRGHTELAIETAQGISDALRGISCELVKQGQLELALKTAHGINSKREKRGAFCDISNELAKQGQLQEAASAMEAALEIARDMKVGGLDAISIEMAKQGRLVDCESTGMGIPEIATRHSLWKELPKALDKTYDWKGRLNVVHSLQSDEARLFYLKGWADNLNVIDVKSETLSQSLSLLINDVDCIEILLQKYAQHMLYFGKLTLASETRLNRSLNIQWLLDIRHRLPNEQIAERSSKNLDSWIDQIRDPDDRDDVRTWADKVSKGNMTEEKFQMKLKSIS
jgi:hypothetical protein